MDGIQQLETHHVMFYGEVRHSDHSAQVVLLLLWQQWCSQYYGDCGALVAMATVVQQLL